MPVSPGSSRVMLQNILSDPKVRAGLSPAALAAFQSASQSGDVPIQAFAQQAAQNPALQAAFQEAHQKGLLGQSFLDKWGPVIGLGTVAALTGGAALPALGGPAATATGGAVAKTSIWDIISGVAGPIAGIGATILNNKATKAAAQIAADAAKSSQAISDRAMQQALGVQTQQYNTSRADTAPYRQAGSGAVNQLSYLAGVPGYTSPTSGNTLATPDKPITVPDIMTTTNQPPNASPAPQPNSLSTLAQPQAPMVKVKAPNGQMGTIPQARLQEAMAAGFMLTGV